ncbi:MAG: hypothetical protein ABI728_15230 [Betaproteobacteria bacterium]
MAPLRTSMQTADLAISGLGSSQASRGVRSALNCIHGVAQVSMVPDESRVSVTYDAFRVFPQQFETAVRVMGCEIERLVVRPGIALAGANIQYTESPAVPTDRSPFSLA